MVLQITPGEKVALQLLAEGSATTSIAARLGMSERDVEAQLVTLFARMGASDRREAIAVASRRGLLTALD